MNPAFSGVICPSSRQLFCVAMPGKRLQAELQERQGTEFPGNAQIVGPWSNVILASCATLLAWQEVMHGGPSSSYQIKHPSRSSMLAEEQAQSARCKGYCHVCCNLVCLFAVVCVSRVCQPQQNLAALLSCPGKIQWGMWQGVALANLGYLYLVINLVMHPLGSSTSKRVPLPDRKGLSQPVCGCRPEQGDQMAHVVLEWEAAAAADLVADAIIAVLLQVTHAHAAAVYLKSSKCS